MLIPISTFTHKQKYLCRRNTPCGCSAQRPIFSKIVGGETAKKRSWGWLVSLTQYSNKTHFCGGSILSSSWILTAAHCVSQRDASDVMIHAGSNNLQDSSQKREVARVFSHPDFDPYSYVNDIALIRLSSPLDMNDPDLAKICLPPETGKILSDRACMKYFSLN
jgi:secreted trypsin-like serine protease